MLQFWPFPRSKVSLVFLKLMKFLLIDFQNSVSFYNRTALQNGLESSCLLYIIIINHYCIYYYSSPKTGWAMEALVYRFEVVVLMKCPSSSLSRRIRLSSLLVCYSTLLHSCFFWWPVQRLKELENGRKFEDLLISMYLVYINICWPVTSEAHLPCMYTHFPYYQLHWSYLCIL